MPVHEIRYQTWQGEVLPGPLRLLSIPRFTLMATFNKWIAMGLFSGGIQLLAYTGYLLISTNPLIREMLSMSNMQMELLSPARIFRQFFMIQFYICLMVTVLSAPKMISPEIQHNALPMIYSRPISRTGYIFGKFLGIGSLLSILTWVQAIILFILMVAIYPSTYSFKTEFWAESVPLLFKGVGIGLLITLCLGLFSLACSATTKNFLHAGILFFIILFGTSFITFFIQETFNMASFPDLGMREIFETLGAAWFYGDMPSGSSYLKTYMTIALWIGGSYLFMRWRLRPVDVYKE
jgi:hypothetical protein